MPSAVRLGLLPLSALKRKKQNLSNFRKAEPKAYEADSFILTRKTAGWPPGKYFLYSDM